MGVAYSALQMNTEAAERFSAAIEIDPDRPMYHLNLGNVRGSLGSPDAAIACYRQAKELDGTSLQILKNLAFTLIENKYLKEGVEELREILKITPGDEEVGE